MRIRFGRKIEVTVTGIMSLLFILVLTVTGCSENNKPVQVETDNTSQRAVPLIEEDSGKIMSVQELKMDTADPVAIASMGDQYFESGNYDQAIELYKKTLELKPDDVDTYNDLGLAYFYTRRPVIAVETLRKGAETDPSFQRIWISLGFVLSSTGQIEEAKSAFSRAIAINPSNDVGLESKRMMESLN